MIVADGYCQRKKRQREPRERRRLPEGGENTQGEAQTGLRHTSFQRQWATKISPLNRENICHGLAKSGKPLLYNVIVCRGDGKVRFAFPVDTHAAPVNLDVAMLITCRRHAPNILRVYSSCNINKCTCISCWMWY